MKPRNYVTSFEFRNKSFWELFYACCKTNLRTMKGKEKIGQTYLDQIAYEI